VPAAAVIIQSGQADENATALSVGDAQMRQTGKLDS